MKTSFLRISKTSLSLFSRGLSGFTLVEALVALVVLEIGIIGLLYGFSVSFNVETANQRETQAVFLAQDKMEELIAKTYQNILATTTLESPLPSPFDKFSRETKVVYLDSNLQESTSDTGLKKIEVTIFWRSPIFRKNEEMNLISFIAKR